MDRFNLTGLSQEVQYYQYALDLITDVFDLDADDDLREQIEKSARHLYGLAHARYIITNRGLAKMVRSPFFNLSTFLYLLLTRHAFTRSRSTSAEILVNVPAYCAISNRCFPWAFRTSLGSSPSSSTAPNAKISITPNPPATHASTAPTLAQHSTTSSSRCTRIWFPRNRAHAMNRVFSGSVSMQVLRWRDGRIVSARL